MHNQGTESQFEETTIDRLHALGYRYQYGGDLERDWREVVMTDWLRAFLQKKYPHLPADALEEAIVRASRPEGITPEHRNMHFHELLTRGFEQKYRKTDGVETFEHIYLVDWANPDANDFCIVGSGKSLSMAYFVSILRHHAQMENPTFVIQVDRTDLDDQLHDQFVAVRALVGEVQHAESIEELRSLSFPMAAWWAVRMTKHRTPSVQHCTACGPQRGNGLRRGRASMAGKLWTAPPVR